jgi:hypothetical protein
MTNHRTPRMHKRPNDPGYFLLRDNRQSQPKVHRKGCYICEDMEFARMGLSLCNLCCECTKQRGKPSGHIAADDGQCDDCGHEMCVRCGDVPPQQEDICTCATPCCEITASDIGLPYSGVAYSCGSQHCPTHGENA